MAAYLPKCVCDSFGGKIYLNKSNVSRIVLKFPVQVSHQFAIISSLKKFTARKSILCYPCMQCNLCWFLTGKVNYSLFLHLTSFSFELYWLLQFHICNNNNIFFCVLWKIFNLNFQCLFNTSPFKSSLCSQEVQKFIIFGNSTSEIKKLSTVFLLYD